MYIIILHHMHIIIIIDIFMPRNHPSQQQSLCTQIRFIIVCHVTSMVDRQPPQSPVPPASAMQSCRLESLWWQLCVASFFITSLLNTNTLTHILRTVITQTLSDSCTVHRRTFFNRAQCRAGYWRVSKSTSPQRK